MAEQLTIKINGDIDDYKKSIGGVGKINKKLGEGLKVLAKASAIGFTALGTAAGFAVNEARKIETITTQFEVLTGSAAQATKTVKELQEFSASTPFQFEGIAKTSQQLLGFGFAADELPGKLKSIGDVASAIGKPMEEVGFIFGQVSAAGKLTGERLLQFQERAIPIGPAIAKTMGIAEESVKDMVSKGKVSFEDFEKAFQSLSQEGGFAFEGMIKQSTTLDGVFSTTKDNISLLAAGIGQELLPFVKQATTEFLKLVQSLRDSEKFLKGVKDVISFTSKVVLGAIEAFDQLGTIIGATFATISESVTAALDLNFKKASKIFKDNTNDLGNEILKIEEGYAEKRSAIDESLYAEKDAKQTEAQEKELVKIKEHNDKKKADDEAEKQAKDDEFEEALEGLDEKSEILTEKEVEIFEREQEAKKEREQVAKIKELKANGKHAEALVAIEKLRNKKTLEDNKKAIEQKKQIQEIELNATQNFLSAGASLAKDGSNEQKALLSANALISTYSAASQALATPPGPPYTFPLAASVVALGIANVAKINSVGFAQGGIFKGGIPGVDSINALVQKDEIIAPTSSFDEVVEGTARQRGFTKSGENGGGSVQEVLVGFTDNAIEIIEQKILERRALGTGLL